MQIVSHRPALLSPASLSTACLVLLRRHLRLFALVNLLRAESGDALNQFHRHRYGKREAERALAGPVWVQFSLECRDHAIAGRIDREVLLPSSEIEQHAAMQCVGGNFVRDSFLGSPCGRADSAPYASERNLR